MKLKGRFNSKLIKKAKFGDQYFDDMGAFESIEKDKVTGAVSFQTLWWKRTYPFWTLFFQDIIVKVHITTPKEDLRTRILKKVSGENENMKQLLSFIDLLDRCLMLDPARRITPKEALTHPFIRG